MRKITFETKSVQEIMKKIGFFKTENSRINIQNAFKITTHDSFVITDLENYMEFFPKIVSMEGLFSKTFYIDIKSFNSIIKDIKSDVFTMILDNDGVKIEIDNFFFNVDYITHMEKETINIYPEKKISIDAKEFLKAMEKVIYCAVERFEIAFKISANEIEIAGTDGCRLALAKLSVGNKEQKEIYIPLKIVKSIIKLLKKEKEFSISWDERYLYLYLNDIKLKIKISDKKFPAYDKIIIPASNNTKITFYPDQLLNVIKSYKDKRIIFDISDNVKITGYDHKSDEIKLLFEGELNAIIEGSPIKGHYNIDYIKDAISHNKTKEVSFIFETKKNPTLWIYKNGVFESIIMPVMV